MYFYYLHSNRNFSTRTRGYTAWWTNEGKKIVYSPRHSWIRLDSTTRTLSSVCSFLYRGVRASVACFYDEYLSIRNVARGGAQCEWGEERGGVSCTLLYYFSGIIYFRLYLHGPRNRIPGDESGETRVTMSSAMRVNNATFLSLSLSRFFSILSSTFAQLIVLAIFYFCTFNVEIRKFWIIKKEKFFSSPLSINLKHFPYFSYRWFDYRLIWTWNFIYGRKDFE